MGFQKEDPAKCAEFCLQLVNCSFSSTESVVLHTPLLQETRGKSSSTATRDFSRLAEYLRVAKGADDSWGHLLQYCLLTMSCLSVMAKHSAVIK